MSDRQEPTAAATPEPLPDAMARPQPPSGRSVRRGATHVVFALSLSRVAGLLRERLFAQYLGTSAAADAFGAALRIPLLLEGLLGERVFSSAFIPRYSRLLAEGATTEASRLARVVAAVHVLLVTACVAAGVLLAPLLVSLVAPGFEPAQAALTVRLLRILFPAVGLLALGAWCLGVLNGHRRFFLPHVVSVLSAASISAALVASGANADRADIAVAAAWGALVGALLQLLVQLPFTLRSLGGAAPASVTSRGHLRDVARNALPAAGRGMITRAGTWVEVAIAGFVSTGALAALNYAQLLYTLPIGLFTLSMSAALLPELAALSNDRSLAGRIAAPLDAALRHTAYLLVGCAVAFIALGDIIIAAVYQGGRFGAADVEFVWAILAASSIGLAGTSMAGLYATAFYALGDARTPLRASIVRLAARGVLGAVLAIPVVRAVGLEPRWGAAGLGAAIGISGWIEFVLLRRWLATRTGIAQAPRFGRFLAALWALATSAAAAAWLVKLGLRVEWPILRAVAILGTYGVVYIGSTLAVGMQEPRGIIGQLRFRARR